MPIEPLSVEPVQPGQPITAQAWNEIVSNLADVINLLNAQAGQSLRVTVNNASANTDEIRVTAIAEGTGGAVFEAAKPVPPDTAFTLTGLPPGNYTIRVAAPGFAPATVMTTRPGTGGVEVAMTRSDPPMPVIFGLPLKEALSALSTAGVVVARVLDVTGRDVAPANPPDAFLNSQVLAHLPDAGTPVPGSQGAQLVISAALEVEPSVVVPSLAGLTLSESRKVLENLGLVLGDVQTRS
jgi:hypothetical protein